MKPRSPLASLTAAAAAAVTFLAHISPCSASQSSKRGLVFTPNSDYPQDNQIWTTPPSDLTWYYNYGASPSPAYTSLPQSTFEFVPMLWGKPANLDDTTFLTTVKNLISNNGINITHVMTFNEPDGPASSGGSDMQPSDAAAVWVKNIIPLQKMGIKVGLPACTGGWGGIPWLNQFLGNCSQIISAGGKTKNCTYDFVPLHWYGNFEGMASHIGTYSAAFPNTSLWVTEYNFDNQDLPTSQKFFNDSSSYMDRIDYVERYSIFAAFRSSKSNVGPNAAMLSASGKLTDIGAWYLGLPATGVLPTDGASSPAGRAWSDLSLHLVVGIAAVAATTIVGF